MIKSRHQSFAETSLFVLNIFLIFLLVFGDRMVIPAWLQPIGRMHPLLLHFPIVVLMMAMVFEFFRFRSAFREEVLYQNFTTALLLTGTLLAAITAIMGFFLSKEPGYSGNVLQWHKWTGAAVVFISTAVYWGRSRQWYRTSIAKTGVIFTFIGLLMAGHYGATLTHGENFIFAPVMQKNEQVPIDKALVYQDVIQPIFDSKCVSCHNDDKLKGKLMLTDGAGTFKGGKTGKLFVPGDPQMSLLLQRVHLPQDDDKHMPPSGKAQLTAEEVTLLYLWVKGKPDLKQKVLSSPATDSLRILAATRLRPAEASGDNFDFAAADEKTIKSLNSNYRVVYPVANGSPGLAVNLYNKSIYTPKVLEELVPLKKQIVSLNMNKMPVKDDELKTIAQFEQLRRLNLNFSEVTGSGLKYLTQLKYLTSLSLAGTKLDPKELKQVSNLKALTELTIWDTGIKDEDLKALKKQNNNITFISGFKDDGKPIKLNVPQIKNTETVFAKPFELVLRHPVKGVDIRYTTDGSDPDSVRSLIYQPGIMISENAIVKARAYKKGWYGSDIVAAGFIKSSYTPDSISFINGPAGVAPKILTDKALGSPDPRDGKWVGSQKDIAINTSFSKPGVLHSVSFNCMRNLGQQILFPAEIQVWGRNEKNISVLLGKVRPGSPVKGDPDLIKAIECKLSGGRPVTNLKLIIKPVPKLAAWFPPKTTASVFVDELFFN